MARTDLSDGKRVGIYRLHNYAVGRAGEPFGMCDEHAAKYDPPFLQKGEGRLEKIADNGKFRCDECEEESRRDPE